MVLTECINFHANHIGAIKNNKDRLMDEYNVYIIPSDLYSNFLKILNYFIIIFIIVEYFRNHF